MNNYEALKNDAKRLLDQAEEKGLHFRAFDIRYAAQAGADHVELTDSGILFYPGFFEVIETGNLSKKAKKGEFVPFPKLVTWQAIIHMELTPAVK